MASHHAFLLRIVFTFAWFATSGCAQAVESGNESNEESPSAVRGETGGSTDSTKSAGQRAISIEPGDGTAVGTRRYAFLVGVDDYDHHDEDQLGPLHFCKADMESMRKTLEEIGFNRVYCLTTGSAYSWQPTKERIEQKLQQLLSDSKMDANDLVLVALSGHGLERPVAAGKTAAYFCPTDAHSDRTETMVPIDWIYEQLDASKAGMKLLLVDACRNLVDQKGGVPIKLSAEARGFMKTLADTRPPQGIAAILSCQSGEVSRENPTLGHGVFSHYILEGLRGKADSAAGNRDGFVSLPELFNYVSDQTTEFVKNNYDQNNRQTPILRGELPNYKLVRYSGPLSPAPPSKLTLSFTIREKSLQGKLLSGASVELFYRSSASRPEVQIASSGKSSSSGRCELELPGYLSSAKGLFTALIRKEGKSKRFPLEGFPKRMDWDFYCPTELPKEITNSLGMKLALIPAGSFQMGSPESEENRHDDEGPRHHVRITKPFYLGVHEVTQAEYEQVMGKNPSYYSSNGSGHDRVEGKNTRRFPVEYVSWNDAVEFCKQLSAKEGQTYRLPTEAEWEYACRAGTTTPFHFGSTLNGGKANVDGNYPYGTETKGPYLNRTTTVGSYSPNAFGLYDMHGNVWEWCQDWYDSDYYENSPSSDPTGPTGGSTRVLRSGSWISFPSVVRAARRSELKPVYRDLHMGFRLLCVPR